MLTFEKSFASNSKSEFWSSCKILLPRQVYKNSNKKFWFDCNKCYHEFECSLSKVNRDNRWCPYCANKKLCENVDCKTCFDKSFASHPKCVFWSTKNKLSVRNVFRNSNKSYWFHCKECDHTFETVLSRFIKMINNCLYCAIPSQILCVDDKCKTCFEKSFASHPKSIYWSERNESKPRENFKGSHKKYWFNCNKCNHCFEQSLEKILNQNSWCPYCCSAPKTLCDNEDCKVCFEKSFSSHPKSIFWSDKNDLKPRQVFKNSDKVIIFKCNICYNEFQVVLEQVSLRNCWCQHCCHKTELKLFEWLEEKYPNTKRQMKFEWSKTDKSYRRYDFYIEELKLLIELDGRQHFIQVSDWKSPEETSVNDDAKNMLALTNGYNILRICQESVWYDREDWIGQLENYLKTVSCDDNKLIKIGSVYLNKIE